jgi:hypothetical protein
MADGSGGHDIGLVAGRLGQRVIGFQLLRDDCHYTLRTIRLKTVTQNPDFTFLGGRAVRGRLAPQELFARRRLGR